MNDIEGTWWVKQPELQDGEMIQLAYPANHTQNGWRAVGGKLFITTHRVIFLPNVIDEKLGGNPLEFSLKQIANLFIKERILSLKELFSGGLVERLGIRLRDGNELLFVVSKVGETTTAIEGVALAK